jgi:hypothetical protein
LRYRAKYSKLIAVVVLGVMLGVGSFSPTAHASSPWKDYWEVVQLVATRNIGGMYTWLGEQIASGFSDALTGEVIRAAFENRGYTCPDKPAGLWWWHDGVWYILTCAADAG